MIKKIPSSKLEIGMFVSDTTPGLSEAGLNDKGQIRRPSTIDKIRSFGINEIYIDTDRGKDSPFSLPVTSNIEAPPTTSIEAENEKAAAIYSQAVAMMGNILSSSKLVGATEIASMDNLTSEISGSILRNRNALLCLSQISKKNEELLLHSINVAILLGIFGQFIGYDRATVHQLIFAGLLHDIGTIHVPDRILAKQGAHTRDEINELNKHVTHGYTMLKNIEGISDIIMHICLQHHENLNGKGYPNQIDTDHLTIYAQMAAICDTYDSITTDHPGYKSKTPFEAMRALVSLAGTRLNKDLVYSFIRCVSIYPSGSLVELSNKRLAIVLQTNPLFPEKPIVKTFFNTRLNAYEEVKTTNLAQKSCTVSIVKAHNPSDFNIKLSDFI